MAIYLLTYDLLKEKDGHDYKPLWKELERVGSHRALYSVWLVNMTGSAEAVAAHFRRYLDSNDLLWVSSVRRNEYWYNARAGTNDWLKRNPPA